MPRQGKLNAFELRTDISHGQLICNVKSKQEGFKGHSRKLSFRVPCKTRQYKERTNSTGKQQPNEHQRQPNSTSHYGAVILQQPNRQQLRHPNISSAQIKNVMALVMLLTYSSAVFASLKTRFKRQHAKEWFCFPLQKNEFALLISESCSRATGASRPSKPATSAELLETRN